MATLEDWALGMGPRTMRRINAQLLGYVGRKTGSLEAAEDITQEVWLASRSYRGESSARYFLYSIARRRVAQWFRQKKRQPSEHIEHELPDLGTSLLSLVDQAAEITKLRQALKQVPEPFQGTLRLWMTGMDGKAIAGALGCSEHTVRSRVSRGRRFLKKELGVDSPG